MRPCACPSNMVYGVTSHDRRDAVWKATAPGYLYCVLVGVYGIKDIVYGVWCIVYGIKHIVYGAWYMVQGKWYIV